MELCESNLERELKQRKHDFPVGEKLDIAKSIVTIMRRFKQSQATAVQWLHEINRISHGDLKPENILV
jgi:serine/threonine protein kinase